jgi:hypothetical protein
VGDLRCLHGVSVLCRSMRSLINGLYGALVLGLFYVWALSKDGLLQTSQCVLGT